MKKVLFVCTGNSCRSVMAEGWFRKLTAGRPGVSAGSAGVNAMDGFPASAETIKVMRDHGADVSGHRSRRLRPEMVRDADAVFVMEELQREWIARLMPEHAAKVRLLTEYCAPEDFENRNMDVPDPIRMPEPFYRNVFSVIRGCVERIVEELD